MIGQETGVLYQYETSSGIQWKTFGDVKVQPKYKGEIKTGKKDGLDVLIYPFGEKSVAREWKKRKEWNTEHANKDGILIGKFENGEWIGSMEVLYLGWRNGEIGYYKEKWEGVESEDNSDFSKYVGEIKNGLPDGQGTFTYPNGSKYVGEYKDGVKHGQGSYYYPNGDKYVGEYKDGVKHGQGSYYYPNGDKYVGEWKDNKKNGQGTYTFPDGAKYVGGFKDGLPNGQVTFTYTSGKKYVGEFENGKRIGHGTHTLSDGSRDVGEFKDGRMRNGTSYYENGNIEFKIVNGKKVKQ